MLSRSKQFPSSIKSQIRRVTPGVPHVDDGVLRRERQSEKCCFSLREVPLLDPRKQRQGAPVKCRY